MHFMFKSSHESDLSLSPGLEYYKPELLCYQETVACRQDGVLSFMKSISKECSEEHHDGECRWKTAGHEAELIASLYEAAQLLLIITPSPSLWMNEAGRISAQLFMASRFVHMSPSPLTSASLASA